MSAGTTVTGPLAAVCQFDADELRVKDRGFIVKVENS